MPIDTISTLEEFDRARERWDYVYAGDQHANVFLTWRWLRAHFSTLPYPWLVLAYRRDAAPYTAFLPLVRKSYEPWGVELGHELFLGGYPRADFTGIVALRDDVEGAIDDFGRHIEQRLVWDNFQLLNVLDPRGAELVRHLARDAYVVRRREPEASTYVCLPPSWQEYLDRLSANARQQLRAKIRKAERLPGYRLLYADEENLEEQIETLLRLHQRHWGGDLRLARIRFGDLFRESFATGCLYLVSAWDGETPIAALAAFTDDQKQTFSFYIAGYDEDYAAISPGRVIVAISIRDAIERGYTTYDFLGGDEPYKAHFGAERRDTANTVVTRTSVRATLLNIARRCVRAARSTRRTMDSIVGR